MCWKVKIPLRISQWMSLAYRIQFKHQLCLVLWDTKWNILRRENLISKTNWINVHKIINNIWIQKTNQWIQTQILRSIMNIKKPRMLHFKTICRPRSLHWIQIRTIQWRPNHHIYQIKTSNKMTTTIITCFMFINITTIIINQSLNQSLD